jgi:hypothetical protein
MNPSRETIMAAVFGLVSGATGFKTAARRLELWSKTPNQPAVFVQIVGEEYAPRVARGLPPKVTIHAEIWLYANVGPDPKAVPEVAMNAVLEAVEAALQPPPGAETQTLGGLVSHCWIEGRAERDPGQIDGQAKAILPIRILVP